MKAARGIAQADLLAGQEAARAIGTMAMRAEVHAAMPYPHRGGCERCYAERRCNVCGVSTKNDRGRCTNGRCSSCHRDVCTPGGETSPGHGYGRIS